MRVFEGLPPTRASLQAQGYCRIRIFPGITQGGLVSSWHTLLWCLSPTFLSTTRPGPSRVAHHAMGSSMSAGSSTRFLPFHCNRRALARGGEGGKGLFCPLFMLALISPGSRLAPSWDQHCHGPPEPCPGPRQNPHHLHLLPAVASCSGESLASPLWPGSAAFPGSRYSTSRPPPCSSGFVKAHFPIRG